MEKPTQTDEDLEFYKNVMEVLCGVKQVPPELVDNQTGRFIKDRSITHLPNDRALAIQYLAHVVKQLGYTDENIYIQKQTLPRTSKTLKRTLLIDYQNLAVTVPGSDHILSNEIIYTGAHYDVQNNMSSCWHGDVRVSPKASSDHIKSQYVATQGADDNTSGVVGCLAILRKIKREGVPLKRTLKVVFFDGEEPGVWNSLCVGSNLYTSYMFAKGEIVKGALIIDMIGGPPTTESVGFVLSLGLAISESSVLNKIKELNEGLEKEIIATTYHRLDNNNCVAYSDSSVFDDNGCPTILLGNACIYSCPSFYHTEKDVTTVVDWDSFKNAVKLACHLLWSDLWDIQGN
eukprot:TRINITY_DN16790_c0_g1_i1.p1 TRINITY_DN16790_c0_g1~~TRINITY_DN16790_c0_g1_i1.p1  ORF type:complete len:346 (-),score=35.73 TRINITY_DN16790_c0_g1_i1:22-1059(-)